MLLFLLVLACGSKGGDSGGCNGVSTDTNWEWSGDCPQMTVPCDIVVEDCALSIDYEEDGGMTMGMPYAGTIDGDTVSFEDGDEVTGCVGTVEDGDTITGTCDGGCTFELSR